MKRKLGVLVVAAVAAVGIGLGTMTAGPVLAEEPDALAAVPETLLAENHPDGYDWLRRSILAAAAHTIGISVEEVKAGLRACHSLEEIGIRHGVRPAALKRGMLAFERRLLAHLVEEGTLTRPQAARIMHFLVEHIDRIVGFHHCDPAARPAA